MKPTILIAEDDPAQREMIGMVLRKEGYRVRAVASAAEVRSLLEQSSYDLVVCDIYLGDATALELLDQIRTSSPGAAIILVTAQGTVETAAAATAAGVFDYLAKPLLLDHLVARVRSALGRHEVLAPAVAPGPESMIGLGRPIANRVVVRGRDRRRRGRTAV